MDVAVIVYYAVAVSLTIVFARLSKSQTIQTAALLIAVVWLFSLIYFLVAGGPRYFFVSAILDGMLAYQFWRMSRQEIFPSVLCCLMIADVVVIVFAAALSLSEYWTIFVLNRLFELMLVYIIGASIYRLRSLRPSDDERNIADNSELKFIAG